MLYWRVKRVPRKLRNGDQVAERQVILSSISGLGELADDGLIQ